MLKLALAHPQQQCVVLQVNALAVAALVGAVTATFVKKHLAMARKEALFLKPAASHGTRMSSSSL